MGAAELFVRATVWLALVGWLAGVLDACAPPGLRKPRRRRVARWLWTTGFLVYAAHVLGAFHVFYDWSHAVAWRETARQTAEATGVASGFGLWLNHLFTVVWGLDAAWWWLRPASHEGRGVAVVAALHGFLYFMVFNATVVFGNGPVRLFGVAICLAPIVALTARLRWQRR